MARRRMIDPNIWSSEDMAKLTFRQRLLVIGLFSNADDYGKGKAKPAYIRSTIFTYDDVPIFEIIDDMETVRSVISIEFYIVEGNSYYRFTNWDKWQTVQKPQISLIPEPVENHSLPSGDPFSPKGKERKRKEEGDDSLPILNSESRKPEILPLVNLYKIAYLKDQDIELVESYINLMDFEVLEDAIRRSAGKDIKYLLKTLGNIYRDGNTKKESIAPRFISPNEQEAINSQRRAEEIKNQPILNYEPEYVGVGNGTVPAGSN